MKLHVETGTRAMLVLATAVLGTAALANSNPPSGAAQLSQNPNPPKAKKPFTPASEGGIAGSTTPCTYQVDDGTAETSFGATSGILVWGNRFDARASCQTISSIQVSFGTMTPVSQPVRIFILSDPNQDGNPIDSDVLATATVVSANENTNIFNTYPITPTVVSGKYFIAVQFQYTAGTTNFPANIDTGGLKHVRSWFGSGYSNPLDPFDTCPDGNVFEMGSVGQPGNWMLRAGGLGEPCADALKRCNGDVSPVGGGNNTVDIDDLLLVIGSWGNTGDPGARPVGDCAPTPNGDCTVNIDDLLTVIGQWGPCPPPSNDACAAAIVVGNGITKYDNVGATTDGPPGTPGDQCQENSTRDVWFNYTASCNGIVTIATEDGPNGTGNNDTVLTVYSGTGCPAGAVVACDDDSGVGLLSVVSFQAAPGSQYKIRVGSWQSSGPVGEGALNISCAPFVTDVCSGAEPVAIGGSVTGTLQGATAETNVLPSCSLPDLGIGRWYSVIGNGTTLTASTCSTAAGQNWDGLLSVFCGPQESEAPCDDLHCVGASNNDLCGPGFALQESVSWCAKNGQKFFVFVAAPSNAFPLPAGQGVYTLSITSDSTVCAPNLALCGAAPPENDECSSATAISNGVTSYLDVSATGSAQAGLDCTGGGSSFAGRDVWFKYTATSTAMLIDTCATPVGSGNVDDTIIEVYSGTCGSLVGLGCDEDSCSAPSSETNSKLTVTGLTVGQDYYVRLALYQGSSEGNATITITPGGTCGNGIIEVGEQCDSVSNACVNCQLVNLAALPDASCVLEGEACYVDGNCDSTNCAGDVSGVVCNGGGCNFTGPVAVGTIYRGHTSTYINGAEKKDADHWMFTAPSTGHYQLFVNANFTGGGNFMIPGTADCSAAIAFVEGTAAWTNNTNYGVPVFAAGFTGGTSYPIRIRPTATNGLTCASGPYTYTFVVIKVD